MKEEIIQEQYDHIADLLRNERLKEALELLSTLPSTESDWELHNKLEQIRTSYGYMLQYMRQGVKDNERTKLHRQLLADTWAIADQARLTALDEVSPTYYHTLRKNPRLLPQSGNLSTLQHILESFQDELAIAKLTGSQDVSAILERHEKAHRTLFLSTWCNSQWDVETNAQATAILQSELIPVNDLCLFVSAVTLSLTACFDERKLNWLLDAAMHPQAAISQRALVGVVFTLHFHPSRLMLYPGIKQRFSLLEETPEFAQRLQIIYLQLLHSQETEKINKKMREEIIPQMLKNVSKLRNMKIDLEELEENDLNPDWERNIENMELEEKMREMTELQLEGADVYMSTFSQLKGYPFFKELPNWFYPFDESHSLIVQEMGLDSETKNSIFHMVLNSAFFCNSDKYSFCFTLSQISKEQREMMLGQVPTQEQMDFIKENSPLSMGQRSESAKTISNQYIQDLYRFYKLGQRRLEFRNIFQERITLYNLPLLKQVADNAEFLRPIAEFLFRKERYIEALEIYRLLTEKGQADAYIYQKIGFCLQKEKHYEEAIDAYQKADMLIPDHVWTLRHLATCHRLLKHASTAAEYYQKVEKIQPDNHSVLFYIGSSLAESGQYEEALQYFFKLNFLANNNVKAWRGIGWCSFATGKYEQAMKYYHKIITDKPQAIDYLNAGHVAWVSNQTEKAVELYEKALALCPDRGAFMEMFDRDLETLLKHGIIAEEIPLMKDLIESK